MKSKTVGRRREAFGREDNVRGIARCRLGPKTYVGDTKLSGHVEPRRDKDTGDDAERAGRGSPPCP